MIWERKAKDHYRWRVRFALLPRRVGERWVWLQHYAWRHLSRDEVEGPRASKFPNYYPFNLTADHWTEWSLPDGYSAWRRQTFSTLAVLPSPPMTTWHRPRPRKVAA